MNPFNEPSHLEKETNQAYKDFKKLIVTHIEDTEKTFTRKIEHESYLCAAECTAGPQKTTAEAQLCTQKCLRPIIFTKQLVNRCNEDINKVLNSCLGNCQSTAMQSVNSRSSDVEMEVARNDYMRCTSQCPPRLTNHVKSAFASLREELRLVEMRNEQD